MKRTVFAAVVSAMLASSLAGQSVAPPEVVSGAVRAVEELGKRVVMGDHKAAVELMYPKWKERLAKHEGGIEALELKLEGIADLMARNGVSIISFKIMGAPKVHEVAPAGGGEEDDDVTYAKWMMLVPTVTQFRIMEQGDKPTSYVIESQGFQVAVADKGKDNWTFINGADVTVAELRMIFKTLPANMELPLVRRGEAR